MCITSASLVYHLCILLFLFNIYVYQLFLLNIYALASGPYRIHLQCPPVGFPGIPLGIEPRRTSEGGPFPGHTELELGLREGGRGEGGLGGLPEPPKMGFDTVVRVVKCFICSWFEVASRQLCIMNRGDSVFLLKLYNC